MSKQLGLAAIAGLTSAIIFLLVGHALPPLIYLAPFPLFLAGLGLGLAAAMVAALVGLAGVIVVGGGTLALPYGVAAVVAPLLVVRQAMLRRTDGAGRTEWYPPGLVLGWLTAVAVGGLAAAAWLLPAHPEGLEGLVREQVIAGLEALGVVEPSVRDTLLALWVPFLPAMLGAAWIVVSVVNAVAAQWLLVRTGRNLRPSPAYQAVSVQDWVAGALVAAVMTAALAEGSLAYLALNLAAVLLVPFVFQGLAWVHGAARRRPNSGLLLALFYGVFFLMFGWAVVAVAGLGLVRHWTKLRRRFGGRSQEDE